MWAQYLCTALGVWLTAAPQILGYHGGARTNHQIVGPLVATFACVAIWEATRDVRWVNVALGGWLVVSSLALWSGWPAAVNGAVNGLLIVGTSLVRGEMRHRFDGGWSVLWRAGGVEET